MIRKLTRGIGKQIVFVKEVEVYCCVNGLDLLLTNARGRPSVVTHAEGNCLSTGEADARDAGRKTIHDADTIPSSWAHNQVLQRSGRLTGGWFLDVLDARRGERKTTLHQADHPDETVDGGQSCPKKCFPRGTRSGLLLTNQTRALFGTKKCAVLWALVQVVRRFEHFVYVRK
jgi:hypothetical protein